ncbi:unnamed protein product [Camellia sinensis]
MGKKKLETHMVADGKKPVYFLNRLQGIFKKAKETSFSLPSLMLFLREKDKQNRESNKANSSKDTVQCPEIIDLDAIEELNPVASNKNNNSRKETIQYPEIIDLEESDDALKDCTSSRVSDTATTVLGIDDDQCGEKPVPFDLGCGVTVNGFLGLNGELSFVSVFDHDLVVMEEGASAYLTGKSAAIRDVNYSTDVMKLSSEDDMMNEFWKENLFDFFEDAC